MKKERRTFSPEFKQEAVALVVEHGYSYSAAGRSLGIRGNLIGRWKRQLEDNTSEAFPGKGKRTAVMSWKRRTGGCGWRKKS
jgi:transposase